MTEHPCMRYSPRFSRPAVAVALLALSLPATGAVAQGKPAATAPALSPAMAPITRAVSRAISGNRAYRTVDYVQRYFRLPGNRGFDLAIDTVASLLRVAGYVEETTAPPSARLVYRIESRPMRDLAWTPEGASITIVGQSAPLQSWPKNLNMIAINSVSTAPKGVTATVIDVGVTRIDNKIVGDVDFDEVQAVAGAITPMPGGTGPMTIGCLLENTLSAAKMLGAFPTK